MKKRWTALFLALTLTLPSAWATGGEESVTPVAPEWIRAEDYLVFPGDEVYEPENWAQIQALRESARAGDPFPYQQRGNPIGSAGTCYELGLCRLQFAANGTSPSNFSNAYQAFRTAREELEEEKGENYYALRFLELQACVLEEDDDSMPMDQLLGTLLMETGKTLEDFFDGPFMDRVSPRRRKNLERDVKAYMERIYVYIDGSSLGMSVPPEARDGRTMVPIRAVAEALGADVSWDQATQQVTLARAGSIVTMTLDSTAATVDGKTVEMDVAPYASNGRTLIPARYVAEFFGQKVAWNGEERRVEITEDKSVMGRSNLEAWALPMGAMMVLAYHGDVSLYGGYSRTGLTVAGISELKELGEPYPIRQSVAEYTRQKLERYWGVTGREELMAAAEKLTLYGSDSNYRWEAVWALSMSEEELEAAVTAAGDEGWRIRYTKELAQKWGDKGIWALDLFRMSNLVQWGYTAGYLTYRESLALLEPAATILSTQFSSWDEAYENYLDGYHWRTRTDPGEGGVWETPLGRSYQEQMKQDPRVAPLLDDSLFETGVIGILEQTDPGAIT